jgi:transposase-like protein
MQCPFCGSENVRVMGAAAYEDGTHISYTCMDCHKDFSSKYEKKNKEKGTEK